LAQLKLAEALPQTLACARPISFWRALRSLRSRSCRSRSCRSSSAWISARDLVADSTLPLWLPLEEAALAQFKFLLAWNKNYIVKNDSKVGIRLNAKHDTIYCLRYLEWVELKRNWTHV
jgi:hypothetical protein